MATKRAFLAPQAFSELYGIVIGLDGDPANQVVGSGGISRDVAFQFIGWNYPFDWLRNVLFWSRVLLVEILTPRDSTYSASRLALVLKPRTQWLYYKDGTYCMDFEGNESEYGNVGQAGFTDQIAKVNPAYRYGDVIRIGPLPSPVAISTFDDSILRTRTLNETYGGGIRNYLIPGGSPIENVQILGSTYNAAYPDFVTEEVLFYDKNVDARTRFGGRGGTTGDKVRLTLCIGGVSHLYEIAGEKIY